MVTNEIEKSIPVTTLAIGGRGSIKELAERIRIMLPSGTKYTESEALAIAQVAFMNGLDPFNGEVWGIKNDKTGEWKGVMVGVKGLRKSGRRQSSDEGGTYWSEFIQVEAKTYGATKPGSVVFECHLRDTVTVQAWGKSVNILTTAGVPYVDAIKMLGKCPEVVGIGIADTGEYSKMGIAQRAKKRAESDAIKQRYQVSFGPGVIAEGEQVDAETAAAIEDSESIFTGTTIDIPADVAAKSENTLLHELGYDEPPEPVEPEFAPADDIDRDFPPVENKTPLRYEPEQLRERIQSLAKSYASKECNEKQRALTVASLDQCFDGDEGDRHAVQYYLTGKQSMKEMEAPEILALLKWMEPTKDADGKYWPNGMSVREANAALRVAMVDKGQQSLI